MPRRILEGVVVSTKQDKTAVVRVERTFLHPLLKKTVRRSKKYHAHDEANSAVEGQKVAIVECAPRSKLKVWELAGPDYRTAKRERDAGAEGDAS
jgi:small subunit ribosomal protein S17